MSRRFGNEDVEMQEARVKHAQREAEEWRQDKIETDKMWRESEQRRRSTLRIRPRGHWRFTEVISESGNLSGWQVELDGKSVGIMVLRENDIIVFVSSADNDDDAPTAYDVMAAFINLYPGVADTPEAIRSLPRSRQRALPSGESPFGPPRRWDE